MFINNISGVINKNLSLFFFSVRHYFSMEGEKRQQELTKNLLFFISLFFFLKIQDITKSKAPIFKRGYHKIFWDKC